METSITKIEPKRTKITLLAPIAFMEKLVSLEPTGFKVDDDGGFDVDGETFLMTEMSDALRLEIHTNHQPLLARAGELIRASCAYHAANDKGSL